MKIHMEPCTLGISYSFPLSLWPGIAGDRLLAPYFLPALLARTGYYCYLQNIFPRPVATCRSADKNSFMAYAWFCSVTFSCCSLCILEHCFGNNE